MKTLESVFAEFDKVHNEAKNTILSCLNSHHEWDQDFCKIANWLLTNEHNPYGYMEESWASAFGSATGVESLLHNLHHAMVDDGDVSFIRIERSFDGLIEYQINFRCFWDLQENPLLVCKGGSYNQNRYTGAKLTNYSDPMEWVKDFEFAEAEWKRRCEALDKKFKKQ